MNYNNDNDMWDWQGQDYSLEDNINIELPKSLLNGVSENAADISLAFSDETTPVKACGDLAYHVTNNEFSGKELEQYKEPSSQFKRRRMLQFETEVLDAPLFNDDTFLRSKEKPDSLEDAISEMADWVAGFTEDTPACNDEPLDPSSEGWIAECFNDAEIHCCTEDISAYGASDDVQIDITDLCNSPPRNDANEVPKAAPVRTHQNVVFKGKKSYIRTPRRLASSVVYPFTFIKPCAVHGDMTLKDINQRIHNPPKPKPAEEDPSVSYPTSAFSGKPVVGKTKIRTEGGKGSITIMRTKG